MRTHAKGTFVALSFLFLFLTSAAATQAQTVPFADPIYNKKGDYRGCLIGDTLSPNDAQMHYNISEIRCWYLSIYFLYHAGALHIAQPPGGDGNDHDRFDSTLFSVDPRLVGNVQIALKDQKIESIDVAAAVSEWDLYDKIAVLQPEKAVDVIRNAKIEGASSCTLKGSGGDDSRPVIKVPDSAKNRAILKQASIPYFIFRRSEVSGQILAVAPPSAVRNVLDKKRIKFKETP
jgi:hypothetical protein